VLYFHIGLLYFVPVQPFIALKVWKTFKIVKRINHFWSSLNFFGGEFDNILAVAAAADDKNSKETGCQGQTQMLLNQINWILNQFVVITFLPLFLSLILLMIQSLATSIMYICILWLNIDKFSFADAIAHVHNNKNKKCSWPWHCLAWKTLAKKINVNMSLANDFKCHAPKCRTPSGRIQER